MRHHTEDRELIARNVRPDSKNRVSLSAAFKDLRDDESFNVYRDGKGRIILEPQVTIPASEAWLFRNKAALESVARGLDQISDAKAIGSFARYAEDDET